MPLHEEKQKSTAVDDNFIFALDIGTRSVIGIAGFPAEDHFQIVCTEQEEYKNRAVVDGQIEDIAETAKIALLVKNRMEEKLGKVLKNVYLAAAGRVLRTSEAEYTEEIPGGEAITGEFISHLETGAIQKAYTSLLEEQKDADSTFFCVGHAVKQYQLDGYEMSSLVDHKGKTASVSLIATFLPREVVESLYATMRRIGLTVAGLTLEPIAAMNAIIPADLRKLNLALCDIGAGTSDIAVCSGGSVTAYTMATIAGDEITEAIMNGCLVDFQTAENLKRSFSLAPEKTLLYDDILGIPHEESPDEFLEKIRPSVEALATMICERISQANGKSPAAVFLVGGGSQTPGLVKLVAQGLSMDEKRVSAGGNAYMKKMVSSTENVFGPEFATPIGIALTAVSQRESDTFVININDERVHLLNTWDTSVLGVLQMSGYQYTQIMGRTGKNLSYEKNGEIISLRGKLPEPAEVLLNGKIVGLSETVVPGDSIRFLPARPGEDAQITVEEAVGGPSFFVTLDNIPVWVGHIAEVNGLPPKEGQMVQNGDKISVTILETLGDLYDSMEIPLNEKGALVNGHLEGKDYRLCPEDIIVTTVFDPEEEQARMKKNNSPLTENIEETKSEPDLPSADATKKHILETSSSPTTVLPVEEKEKTAEQPVTLPIHIVLNGRTLSLEPRMDHSPHQFFDLLNFAGIDPENPQGNNIVQLLNGHTASYLDILKDGDQAEIYWA